MAGLLAGLATSILPSLLSGKGGGLIKTIGDIGKSLIVPIGTKLVQAGKSALSGLLSSGKEILREEGSKLLERGYKRITGQDEEMGEVDMPQETRIPMKYKRPVREPIQTEYLETPKPIKRPRKRPRRESTEMEIEEPIKKIKPQYEEYEGVSQMFNNNSNKRDYEI